MNSKIRNIFSFIFDVESKEKLKVVFLSITFFLVIFSNTLIKELKDAVFSSVVGKSYVPWAKISSMLILIPALLFYSKLVDNLRRYQLLAFFSALYGFLGLIFVYYFAHPVIGLSNTDSSPYRIFGWLFYYFLEGFTPFIVSVFWAFSNSINSPESAKNNYGLIIASSKIGGMVSSGFAWKFLNWQDSSGKAFYSDVFNHQVLLAMASIALLCVPIVVFFLMKKVPGKHLHGYEAVYKFEKQAKKEGKSRTGMFSGLKVLISQPYVFGIFLVLFFYEVINVVIAYERLGVAKDATNSISAFSAMLFHQIFLMHLVGFFIAFLGTRFLLNNLGIRFSLLLMPIVIGLLLFYFLIDRGPTSILIVFVFLRALNYTLGYPLRENLYIPTTKETKFKAKSWIDTFGGKLAKSSGATFNVIAESLGRFFLLAHSIFFAVIISFWILVGYLLGRKFNKTVKNDRIIDLK